MAKRVCAECRKGDHEVNEDAVCLVVFPNPDHPNLRIKEWVCDDHYSMLCDDYGADVKTLESAESEQFTGKLTLS